MPDSRVIIVAPSEYDSAANSPVLTHQLEEVAAVLQAFFKPILLIGRVTEKMIGSELRRGAVGFWFVGHASTEGVMLSDVVLSPPTLGLYLKRAGVQWSYLNTCDSGALVAEIQAVHTHDIFANIVADVADAVAARNGRLLAEAIADSNDIASAYRWVVSGRPSILRYFPGEIGENVTRQVENRTVEQRLRRLEQLVLGDDELGLPSWRRNLDQIRIRLGRIETILAIETVIILIALVATWYRPLPTPEIRMYIVTATPTGPRLDFDFPYMPFPENPTSTPPPTSTPTPLPSSTFPS